MINGMHSLEPVAKCIILAGIILIILGGVLWLVSRIPGFEKIPGTIKMSGSGITCVFPILVCIVVSIVLTILLNLVLRWINH
ncbi:MAG: DUF2905 domain-containing protein [Anaerolineaceae bacterium]